MASDEFGNHTCNDIYENITSLIDDEIFDEIKEWNGDDELEERDEIPDWMVMNFLKYKMEQELLKI